MKLTGKADFDQILDALTTQIGPIARGAARAGARVIANKAMQNCRDPLVAASIGISTRSEPGIATATVRTKGKGAFRAPWAENGTDPHFISVDSSQSGGRTVRRVNRLGRQGEMVIGGNFVGDTVHHPGARPYPFMRPAFDTEAQAAFAAAGGYITTRLTKEGLLSPPAEPKDDE